MLSGVFYALTPPANWNFSGPRWNIPFSSNQVMHLELFGTVSLSTTMKDQNQSNNFLHVCLVTIRQLVWLCDSNTNYHVAALSKGDHQQKITWIQLPPLKTGETEVSGINAEIFVSPAAWFGQWSTSASQTLLEFIYICQPCKKKQFPFSLSRKRLSLT